MKMAVQWHKKLPLGYHQKAAAEGETKPTA